MEFVAKFFDELSNREVYEILKARAAVFIKEQGINYLDEDDVDYKSLHCFFWKDEKVVGYLRAFFDERHEGFVNIGRVLTIERGQGVGKELMERGIEVIREKMGCERLRMDAQKHAAPFYEKLGFSITSEEYLEEGVVHVDMEM